MMEKKITRSNEGLLTEEHGSPSNTIGSDINFAAKEAYKRLRTNLQFSFAGENGCRVIGVTSSLRGEGKSTTSSNIAFSFAEMGKKVLLLDSDMRLPNVHKLLALRQAPGLSNLLTGVNSNDSIVQPSGIHPNLSIIAAGEIPPNPSELLSSKRMADVLELLRKEFDVIVVDLPPIDAVTDALIVGKLTNGMVLVVRENYADKSALDSTVRQLKYQNINILGLVLNCSESNSGHYYKKNYYYKSKDYKTDDDYEFSDDTGLKKISTSFNSENEE